MNNIYAQSNPDCSSLQPLLSEYIDNTLSARQVWEVEKHLARCADCTEQLNRLRSTVEILQAAPRYDTGKDFMASLHARLDGLEPEPLRARSALAGLRDWLSGLGTALEQHRLPAFSVGLAILALILFSPGKPIEEGQPKSPPVTVGQKSALNETIQGVAAESASNPFADPAADNLEARSVLKDAAQL